MLVSKHVGSAFASRWRRFSSSLDEGHADAFSVVQLAPFDGLATKLDQATRSLENTNAIELAEHITSVAKQAVDYVEQLSANARKMGGKWDSTQKRDAARDFFEKQVAAHGITLTREQVVSAHRSIESVLGAAREG